jgi:hypothetical protein
MGNQRLKTTIYEQRKQINTMTLQIREANKILNEINSPLTLDFIRIDRLREVLASNHKQETEEIDK